MREIAEDDRPRERLLAHGPEVLSDADLVAILLGSGVPGVNVVDLARSTLEDHGGLAGLVRADSRSLQRARGLGPARAALLLAAIELGRRIQQVGPEARPLLLSPAAVHAYFAGRYIGKTKEELYVAALDTRGRLLGAPTLITGTVNGVPIRLAEVFREPLVRSATSFLLVHNHPSGDPRPSPQDIAMTKEIHAAARLLDLELLDHVIVGAGRYVSLKTEGYAFRDTGRQP
jgi:DNA repair protein RadC